MTDIASMLPPEAFRAAKDGKFKPKLSSEERCAVLALVRKGVKRDLVAGAFGIDRRTVAHVANDTSPHYKETRNELKRMGEEEFIATYLTEAVVKRVREYYEANKAAPDAPTHDIASGRAKKYAGLHTVKPEQCDYSHRIEIKYFKDDPQLSVDGWYYRDLDGDFPDQWLHNGEESLTTSQSCYEMAQANLMDAIKPQKAD